MRSKGVRWRWRWPHKKSMVQRASQQYVGQDRRFWQSRAGRADRVSQSVSQSILVNSLLTSPPGAVCHACWVLVMLVGEWCEILNILTNIRTYVALTPLTSYFLSFHLSSFILILPSQGGIHKLFLRVSTFFSVTFLITIVFNFTMAPNANANANGPIANRKLPQHGIQGAFYGGDWVDLEDCANTFLPPSHSPTSDVTYRSKCDTCPNKKKGTCSGGGVTNHQVRSRSKLDSSKDGKGKVYDVVIVGAGCIGTLQFVSFRVVGMSILFLFLEHTRT